MILVFLVLIVAGWLMIAGLDVFWELVVCCFGLACGLLTGLVCLG